MSAYNSVFDKLILGIIGPKSFLFGTAQFSLWTIGAVNCDYIITNSINCLLISSRCICPMLQNISKTLAYKWNV